MSYGVIILIDDLNPRARFTKASRPAGKLGTPCDHEKAILEAYSPEFRRDVLATCDAGKGTRAIALKYCLSASWCDASNNKVANPENSPRPTRDALPNGPSWRTGSQKAYAETTIVCFRNSRCILNAELSVATLCRVLPVLKLIFKKVLSGSVVTSRRSEPNERSFSQASTPINSSFSMRLGPRPTWREHEDARSEGHV